MYQIPIATDCVTQTSEELESGQKLNIDFSSFSRKHDLGAHTDEPQKGLAVHIGNGTGIVALRLARAGYSTIGFGKEYMRR